MQLPGTDYTIAGMVASQCGIPLFAPFEGNASASVSSFFPQNICLGDILKNSGYQNYFVQGANLRFAGKDVFLKSHGFDHLYGAEELKTVVADRLIVTTGASTTIRCLMRHGRNLKRFPAQASAFRCLL
ncbi:sulfatase-like hydrolase/transferase [Salmonella enterica subsp. enterica serovar Infantis]